MNDDTISRQAAINALSCENPTEIYIFYEDAVKALNDLPSAQPEQQWIPCSERLPEDERRSYWVCTDNGYQHECRWTNVNPSWTNLTTDWHWNIFDIPQYSKVIAWMQLPEPYEVESDE